MTAPVRIARLEDDAPEGKMWPCAVPSCHSFATALLVRDGTRLRVKVCRRHAVPEAESVARSLGVRFDDGF